MKLSTKGTYGLRAVIDLSLYGAEEAVSISSIAKRQALSEGYLEQLMGKLRKAGIICSVRGAQGGYKLAKTPDQISVGDILRALEGDLNPVECGCAREDTCVLGHVWKRVNDSINQAVDGIMLSTILEESRQLSGENTTPCKL